MLGHARAVGLLVVQHSHRLGLELVDDELGRKWALLVVTANRAEEVVALQPIGHLRGRGTGGDGHNAFFFINLGGRHGHARAHVGDRKLGAGVEHAVGCGHGLLGLTRIVNEHRLVFAAIHAASGIHGFHRREQARLDFIAILGVGACHGNGNADEDGFCCMGADGCRAHQCGGGPGGAQANECFALHIRVSLQKREKCVHVLNTLHTLLGGRSHARL